MKIKVCGMRDAENIKAVSALDIDMIGFIFYPKSTRYVSMINSEAGTMPDYSEERLEALSTNAATTPVATQAHASPQTIHKPLRVGVFVDDMPQNIVSRVVNYQLDYVQLHGHESVVMIENLKQTLVPDIAPNIKIIKAFGIASEHDFEQCKPYEGVAHLFLFDTQCPTAGGCGQHFNWQLLQAYKGHTPFLLSGGIGPDDADALRQIQHERMVGIELNSRFETSPAMKDVEKLHTFIEKIKKGFSKQVDE